jgi:hypothetical protein
MRDFVSYLEQIFACRYVVYYLNIAVFVLKSLDCQLPSEQWGKQSMRPFTQGGSS